MLQKNIWDNEYKQNGEKWHKETKLPSLLKGKKVLELGVGNGKTLKAILRQKPKEVVALDFSKEAIDLCKSKFDNVDFIAGDALKLDLGRFDVIVCYYFLNSFLEKPRRKMAKKIQEMLNPGGIVLFEDFGIGDFRQKGKMIEENTIVKENGLYCHFFSLEELRGLFSLDLDLKVSSFRPFRGKKDERRIISGIMK